jgi:hypothetical protein
MQTPVRAAQVDPGAPLAREGPGMKIDDVDLWQLRPGLQAGQVQAEWFRPRVVDRLAFGDPLSKRPCARHVHTNSVARASRGGDRRP